MQVNTQVPEKPSTETQFLEVQDIWHTIQGEGPFAGRPAIFVRLSGCNLDCRFCFHAATMITLSDCTRKRIEDVQVGDEVLSYDTKTQKFEPKKVLRIMRSTVSEIYKLPTQPKTFATGEHPVLVRDKGWVAVKDLVAGDHILRLTTSERMRLCNPMKNPEIARQVSQAMEGRPGPLSYLSPTQYRTHCDAVSKRMTKNNPMKDPKTALKGFLNRKDRGKRTQVESFVEDIVDDLGVIFTGDGSLVVANKVPDFRVEGEKKLIEVWDKDQTDYLGRGEEWQKERQRAFASEGYETLFLPVTPYPLHKNVGKRKPELREIRNLEVLRVRREIAEFARNGFVVEGPPEKITKESNPKAWTRLAGRKDSTLNVYNFEVEDTHTYIANGLIVHNCDTDYTSIRERYDPKALARHILEEWQKRKGRPLVVITGGEPFRQQLHQFVGELRADGLDVQIETNGTIYQDWLADAHYMGLGNFRLVCSPKTPKIHDKMWDHIDAVKYVVQAGEIDNDGFPTNVLGTPMRVARPPEDYRGEIYLQPLDVQNPVENAKNLQAAAEACLAHGFRLTVQMHKMAGLP